MIRMRISRKVYEYLRAPKSLIGSRRIYKEDCLKAKKLKTNKKYNLLVLMTKLTKNLRTIYQMENLHLEIVSSRNKIQRGN